MNDLRLHNTLVHSHLRLRHTIRGRSGPILISRGRVVTHACNRDDHVAHFGTFTDPLVGSADNDHADTVPAHRHRVDDDSLKTQQQCTTVWTS